MMMPPPSLQKLARAQGIATEYTDIEGKVQQASSDTLLAILAALGLELAEPGAADALYHEFEHERWQHLLEPVTVAWQGHPIEIELCLPHDALGRGVEVQIELEAGGSATFSLSREATRITSVAEVSGRSTARHAITLPELPLGRHRLRVETAGRTAEGWLFHAPSRAFEQPGERAFGVFAPTYALASGRGLGAGDYGDLSRLCDFNHGVGGRFVGTLPLLPTYLEETFDPSPYAPVSRLFWNEFFIDAAELCRTQNCVRGRELIEANQGLLQAERATRFIDYQALASLKKSILSLLSAEFFNSSGSERARFEQFVASKPAVNHYAQFRAMMERHKGYFKTWPAALNSGRAAPDAYDHEAFNYHRYVQWRAAEQIERIASRGRARKSGLYLDLPIGAHGNGYDAWAYESSFLNGVAAGAPPDPFFSKGQNWGFAPLSPRAIRQDGYAYVHACLEHHLSAAEFLRIDHVMGLHRIYCVPSGMAATAGAYVHYKANELYALLTLASQKHRSTLIGEDLGTVPDEVRAEMKQRGLLSMYVAQFSVKDTQPSLSEPGPSALATLNTHDMPSFAAFARGLDIADRQKLGLLSEAEANSERQQRSTLLEALSQDLNHGAGGSLPLEELFAKLVKRLAKSPAPYLLLNLEDLWLEEEPQNVPGTHLERPNWRRKMRADWEALLKQPSVSKLLAVLSETRSAPGAE